MKKIVIYIVPILTLCLGYALRWVSEPPAETIVKEKLVYQNEADLGEDKQEKSTSKKKESSEPKEEVIKDIPELDTIDYTDTIIAIDSTDIFADSIQIKRDRVIKKTWLNVKKSEKVTTKLDSLKSEAMGIRNVGFSDKILIEFWESPFNFTGYKLSKSKLIVYGLDPNTNYFLRDRNNDTLELNSSDDSFNFVFTDDFRPLEPNLRDSL